MICGATAVAQGMLRLHRAWRKALRAVCEGLAVVSRHRHTCRSRTYGAVRVFALGARWPGTDSRRVRPFVIGRRLPSKWSIPRPSYFRSHLRGFQLHTFVHSCSQRSRRHHARYPSPYRTPDYQHIPPERFDRAGTLAHVPVRCRMSHSPLNFIASLVGSPNVSYQS